MPVSPVEEESKTVKDLIAAIRKTEAEISTEMNQKNVPLTEQFQVRHFRFHFCLRSFISRDSSPVVHLHYALVPSTVQSVHLSRGIRYSEASS